MKFKLLIILLLHAGIVFCQDIVPLRKANGDCSDPITIMDTIFGPTSAPDGPGRLMEITGDKTSLYWFEKEHNTVWYKIPFQVDCEFTFDLIPQNPNDDYDFLLFRYTDNLCNEILTKEAKPVRTNISRNNVDNESWTGLNSIATESFLHSGPGDDYSKSIEVKKGEIYYLVVDNVYDNGLGHSLWLHLNVKNKVQKTSNPLITITISDAETKEPVNGNLLITCNKDTIVSHKNIAQFSKELLPKSMYYLEFTSEGYFPYNQVIKTKYDTSVIFENIELNKIEAGKTITLQNLYFEGGNANFLPESYPVLRNLYLLMKQNPTMKIEIQGHVNQPYNWETQQLSSQSLLLLSQQRASAVLFYLVERGIEYNRMKTNGFSNLKMIYPYAKTEEEMRKNRRVEVLIIEK